MRRKLEFFVAGVQKGGTTALWHFLRHHPQIGLPVNKELHFFDNEAIDWKNPPYEKLHEPFAQFQNRDLWGEVTPIYSYWPDAIERIHCYNPDSKIILIFRDPVLRAFSHWRMEKARAAEILSFSEAIREGRARVGSDSSKPGYHRVYSYVERGFYSDQVARVVAIFPPSQVLFIRQKDLLNDHDATLARACDFMNIERPENRIKNEFVFSHEDWGQEIPQNDRQYLREIFSDDQKRFETLTGMRLLDPK